VTRRLSGGRVWEVTSWPVLRHGGGRWRGVPDGGVFNFGTPFFGSLGANPPATPVVALSTIPGGDGYYLLDGGGDVFGFGVASSFTAAG
jgi:hypothetical protein